LTKPSPPQQPFELERFDEFVEGLTKAAMKVADEIKWELQYEHYIDIKKSRWLMELARLIIAARRTRHLATRIAAERALMERQVAANVLELMGPVRRSKTLDKYYPDPFRLRKQPKVDALIGRGLMKRHRPAFFWVTFRTRVPRRPGGVFDCLEGRAGQVSTTKSKATAS
jgi:hypothetical protein